MATVLHDFRQFKAQSLVTKREEEITMEIYIMLDINMLKIKDALVHSFHPRLHVLVDAFEINSTGSLRDPLQQSMWEVIDNLLHY